MNGNDGGARQISARDLLTVIFRRKVPVTIVAVIVAAATLTAASRTGSVYEAASKIYLRRSGPNPLATSWTPFYGLEEEMNTEVEIVRSVEVMSRAVEILRERDVHFEQTVGDSIVRREPTIGDIAAGLAAVPIEMSNVLIVKYTGSMPRFVQAAANAAAEAYVEHRARVRSSSGIDEYFGEQLAVVEERLLDLLTRQLHLRREYNIQDLEWQNRMSITRLNEVQAALAEVKVERLTQEKKLDLAKQRMEEDPDLLIPFPGFGRKKIGEQMIAEYWRLRSQRDDKAALLTETNPEVRILDEKIAMMEERLREQVKADLIDQEFLVEDLKAEEASYEATIAGIVEEIRQTPDAIARIDHLQREIQYTYLHYEKLVEKMLDTMASEADDMRLSNAKIISPATAQLTKVGRMQGLYVAFSILLGVTLGVGFGFLLENLDQSVKSAADVEEELGVTLLGSVPELRRMSKFTQRIDRTFGHRP